MNTINKVAIGCGVVFAFVLVFGIPAVPQVGPAERIASAASKGVVT
jgi:hypothetical protein